ncbi:MAG: hypothetical protein RL616_1411 [Verrucomicrobiota bacterium]|jgi:prepilin-type N-terminal cleavage/methylation domain-containing protein
MKLSPNISRSRRAGFTLPEILIALTVFMLLLAGVLSANIFGLRMFQVNSTKLNATEWSRNTFGKITEEVHACAAVQVGNLTNGTFAGLLDGETQRGSGLLIYPTTNVANFTIYFVNAADQTFRRTIGLPSGTNTVILADSITNTLAFSAQDFSGNVLTNAANNRVIHVLLEFYQPERFLLDSDYYKLETSVTRRALQ